MAGIHLWQNLAPILTHIYSKFGTSCKMGHTIPIRGSGRMFHFIGANFSGKSLLIHVLIVFNQSRSVRYTVTMRRTHTVRTLITSSFLKNDKLWNNKKWSHYHNKEAADKELASGPSYPRCICHAGVFSAPLSGHPGTAISDLPSPTKLLHVKHIKHIHKFLPAVDTADTDKWQADQGRH